MKKSLLFLFSIASAIASVFSQVAPFQVLIEPLSIDNVGGLQSFAFAQHQGKWLVFGGRLDGLHRRQPFASFDVAGNNNQIWVIDPVSKQKWTATLSNLSTDLQEQLSSTNMQFHQEGERLYLIGGYGYHQATSNRKTFNFITAVNVPDLMQAIIDGKSIQSFFRQQSDSKFSVTGGHLKKINQSYYLVGGNKFDGNYNPMGNPTYTQEYTNSIHKFNILDNGTTFSIQHVSTWTDTKQLRRRDYNVVPQIDKNGAECLTAFSGVFQEKVDLPFLNSVFIDSLGYVPDTNFQQYYNHYHCAVLPVYDANKKEMHSVFFGGIAQYYDSAGILVQDNNVPFVKTIARVTRDSNGKMAEYKLPIEMPSLLGAGAEFIADKNIPQYENEVLKLNQFTQDTTFVGYIYGGISSTAANIFFTNTGAESVASSQIFKVFVVKNATLSVDNLNEQSIGTLKMNVAPNPNNGLFSVSFELVRSCDVNVTIYDIQGKIIEERKMKKLESGTNMYQKKLTNLENGGIYFIRIETPWEKAVQKIVIEP